ncbi:kugelei [Carabus blaptoides fortunei]
MSPDSGIVTLTKPLDRELKASYNLTVLAIDQGTPQMSSVATLIVNVQDMNDNPPEFASKYYFAVVPEIDAINTDVIRVLATSKDTRVNADIYYSIVGGNEHNKFKIDNRTGVISIAEMLDYERAKDYFLTIQVTDGGSPPLSNRANVNITVTDSNDNAPVFMQVSYSARIPEDADVGDKIIQASANDLDSGDNGRVTYFIENGNRQTHFVIDPDNGYISVADQLNRESISSYVLEILAKDNGLPVLSRSVLVNIEISDTNDNPPLFSQSNYSTIVQEDKPLGYPILKFTVTDADASPNEAPYTFDFHSGNDGGIFPLAAASASSAYVSDGRWHEVHLERDKHSARLTVDNIHVAHGSALGISDILNLQNDNMFFGAEVHQHPSILGFEDIQRGFSGCMDDVRVSRVSVPLHMSGDSSIAVLMRVANVEFSCDVTSVLVPPGPCGSQPCMNGGTCLETSGGYECQCHARFKGLLCEQDTDPCQSQPCLFGGKCSTTD